MVVLLPYNQITAASFSMPFYHTSIKRDHFLYTLPLIYITSVKGLVWVVIPLLTRSRVDLPKNKSKLCQTFSLCFWFGTTKWITKRNLQSSHGRYTTEFEMRIKQVKQEGQCHRFTFSIMDEGLNSVMSFVCTGFTEKQWSHRSSLPKQFLMLCLATFPPVYFTFTKCKLEEFCHLEIWNDTTCSRYDVYDS